MSDVASVLKGFVARYMDDFPDLYEIHDPQWRSPCEVGEPHAWPDGTQVVRWRPVARRYAEDFAGLENALETTIHPDIKAYYGAFWSGGLEARASEGHVSLILLWNPADADRLVENLIGHAMAKQRHGRRSACSSPARKRTRNSSSPWTTTAGACCWNAPAASRCARWPNPSPPS